MCIPPIGIPPVFGMCIPPIGIPPIFGMDMPVFSTPLAATLTFAMAAADAPIEEDTNESLAMAGNAASTRAVVATPANTRFFMVNSSLI
jgi:hypothetical protein